MDELEFEYCEICDDELEEEENTLCANCESNSNNPYMIRAHGLWMDTDDYKAEE